MANHLRSDLDQFRKKAAERPSPDLLRKSQAPQKVAQIVCKDEQPEPHLIPDEILARKPCPIECVFPFHDLLLYCSMSVGEMHNSFVPGAHVGHDEAGS